MKYVVIYYANNGTSMECSIKASSRDDAFRAVERHTGGKAICEKWELMDVPAVARVAETMKAEEPSKDEGSIMERLPRRKASAGVSVPYEEGTLGFGAGNLVIEFPFLLLGVGMMLAEKYLLFEKIENIVGASQALEIGLCVPFILFPIGMSFVIGYPIFISPILLSWLAYVITR